MQQHRMPVVILQRRTKRRRMAVVQLQRYFQRRRIAVVILQNRIQQRWKWFCKIAQIALFVQFLHFRVYQVAARHIKNIVDNIKSNETKV